MITKEILEKYEPTIGIECHVQLNTQTKLFSGADNDAREGIVSPICFGLPGTLPVLNKQAVRRAIQAGVALNAHIALISSFDRKHYFYPDLPKGYQITQLERPIVGNGVVDVPLEDSTFSVRITRAHIEEDAGKLTHPEGVDYSLVDYNRAGTPLIEIVSEADMHSPKEAKAFAQELYYTMKYANVTNGSLYYGNMRFDVNVSVAKKGASKWGTRAEVKNLNSFRSVEKAVEYEFQRQVEMIERGERVIQETRGWNDAKQKTISQRSKEEAQDYRYFPEADVPPIEVTQQQIENITKEVTPLLPWTIRKKLSEAGINIQTTNTLLEYPDIVDSVLEVQKKSNPGIIKLVVKLYINTELKFRKNQEESSIAPKTPLTNNLIKLVDLYNQKKISSNALNELYEEIREIKEEADMEDLAKAKGILQVSDSSAIEAVVEEVLSDETAQKAVNDIKNGEMKAIGFLVGMVMKRSKGQANPAMAKETIIKKLQ